MADTLQFELVSPERRLASMAATEVRLPGASGDMTAMPDHAETITSLRPGIVQASGPEGREAFMVTGGFADISAGAASVLAEIAIPLKEVTSEVMEKFLSEAREAAENAPRESLDEARKVIDDLETARAEIGV